MGDSFSSSNHSWIPIFPARPWESAHIFFAICFTGEMAFRDSELHADSLVLASHSDEACGSDLTFDSK